MARLSNTPVQQLTLDLERRKSYAFRCILVDVDHRPIDLTDCTLRFVLKQYEYDDDNYDSSNELTNVEATIPSPESGVGQFSFQAAELDGPPGVYNYTIVLWTPDGFSAVIVKGILNLHANTDSLSMSKTYTDLTAGTSLELTLRGNDVVNIVTNTMSQGVAVQEIVANGRPDERGTLDTTALRQVLNAIDGTLFISLDGAGLGFWAWRKLQGVWRRTEGLQWSDIAAKPSTFPPSHHEHSWMQITNKPSYFPPATHYHDWLAILDKPTQFPPSGHRHSWSDLDDVPPIGADVDWSDIQNVPSSFTPTFPFTVDVAVPLADNGAVRSTVSQYGYQVAKNSTGQSAHLRENTVGVSNSHQYNMVGMEIDTTESWQQVFLTTWGVRKHDNSDVKKFLWPTRTEETTTLATLEDVADAIATSPGGSGSGLTFTPHPTLPNVLQVQYPGYMSPAPNVLRLPIGA